MRMNKETVLEVHNIDKSFTGTKALNNVSMDLFRGEVHAVVGENGAGKSTLMKIIDGIYQPDCGEIVVGGKIVNIASPHDAQRLGIGFVHQEIALCQHITVAENICMSELTSQKGEFIDFKKYIKKSEEVLKDFHPDIDMRMKVSELSISNQQIVEIAKALSLQCGILILDEPTAALTESESEVLFKIIDKLRGQGISILYISHRMAEIFTLCDRVTILRDGSKIDTLKVFETDEVAVVNKMVGRELKDLYPPKNAASHTNREIILNVNNLGSGRRFENINFSLYRGEILGIAGLIGAGRSEVVKAICGLYPKTCGMVSLNGSEIRINDYRDAIEKGVVYLTEDRKKEGLFLRLGVQKNVTAMILDSVSKGVQIDRKTEASLARSYIKTMNIKCSDTQQHVGYLSGGNQQKVLMSKLIAVKPVILFLDEPTRGVDVGAKSEIHMLLRDLAHKGVGIVMISSELPEVIGMCDRVIVMHEGRMSGIVSGRDINENKLIQLASGLEMNK